MEESNNSSPVQTNSSKNSQKPIAGAIVLAGIMIAGAILLKGNVSSTLSPDTVLLPSIELAPVSNNDRILGSPDAKLALIEYEDFQCPFCGRFVKDVETSLRNNYVKNGDLQFVYRDYAFLGPESVVSAQAAMCAGDQGKFWEYHDYLFSHQNGENQGNFSNPNLKTFAKNIGLNTTNFNQCLDSQKYAKAVQDSVASASKAGVAGTPTGFLVTKKDISKNTQNKISALIPANMKGAVSFYNQKNVLSLNGALPSDLVNKIIDILLKN